MCAKYAEYLLILLVGVFLYFSKTDFIGMGHRVNEQYSYLEKKTGLVIYRNNCSIQHVKNNAKAMD